jgi:hypothetical protein
MCVCVCCDAHRELDGPRTAGQSESDVELHYNVACAFVGAGSYKQALQLLESARAMCADDETLTGELAMIDAQRVVVGHKSGVRWVMCVCV